MNDTLLEIEERGWQALSSKENQDFCQQWLAEDALMVVPGMIIDRDTFLQALPSEQPWASHRIDDARTVQFTDECAALLYRVTARRNGQDPYVAIITSVYAHRNGTWKLIYHQQTPTPS